MLLRLKSQSSSCVSLEKSASTAPARVPVARYGEPVPGDQANVAVLGISRNLTMMASGGMFECLVNVRLGALGPRHIRDLEVTLRDWIDD